jgi:hypothetical protein
LDCNDRHESLLAAETTIPGIVWFVVIVGGAVTIAFGSLLGGPSVLMHLGMCCLLAVSGVFVLVLIIAEQPIPRRLSGLDGHVRLRLIAN